jgi:hypothetical protein
MHLLKFSSAENGRKSMAGQYPTKIPFKNFEGKSIQ